MPKKQASEKINKNKCPKTLSGRHHWITNTGLKGLTGGFAWCEFCEIIDDLHIHNE